MKKWLKDRIGRSARFIAREMAGAETAQSWLKRWIGRLARFAAREMADEFAKSQGKAGKFQGKVGIRREFQRKVGDSEAGRRVGVAKGRGKFPAATSAITRLQAIAWLHEQFAAESDAAPRLPEAEAPSLDSVAVAVVVPVFDGAAYLADCLESVQRQTFDAWRCYVVDDASTDETSEITESFAACDGRFVALRHGRNAGSAAARNTGLIHAEEPLVTFLDADDVLTPSSLQRRVAVMQHFWPDRTVAGAWGDVYDAWENVSDAAAFDGDLRLKPAIHVGACDGECPFAVHAPLLRAELLRRMGGFDERIQRGAEDWDLWHRLLRHGYVFEYADGPVGLYRHGRRSMTATGPEGRLDASFRLLSASEKTARVDERLAVDPHAAAPLARLRFSAGWLRRVAAYSGVKLAASGDRSAADYRDMLGRVSGVPRPMTIGLESRVEAGLLRGFGIGGRDRLPAIPAEQVARIAKVVAEELRTAAVCAPWKDEEGAATVDCRPLLAEPDVVVVAETAAAVCDLVGFVRRLRGCGWDAVALDADYAHGDQGATRAWRRADVPLVPYNHLWFGRVRPARLLVCRPFGPTTAELAAAVGRAGGVVVEWSGGVVEARLPCNDTESMSFDFRWNAETPAPEKGAGGSLEPAAPRPGPPEGIDRRDAFRFGGRAAHALNAVREEGSLDAASIELLESLRDKHRGETVVIVGNGPSLNDTDLGLLAGVATIGVNGIFYASDRLPEPLTYYVVEDAKVFAENTAAIKAFECRYKLFPALYRDAFDDDEIDRTRMGFFRANWGFYGGNTGNRCWPRFSTDAVQRLYCGQSVTIINLQLAYWMGFSRAVLIGMDFSYTIPSDAVRTGNDILSQSDDVNHFHPDYFGKGKTWRDPKLDRVLANYALAREMFAADGREIVNATVGGALELFHRMPLAETLDGARERSGRG